MDVTVDLYKELQLDRSWDEKTIRKKIKDLNKFWVKREAACNDKEQLLIIDKVKKNLDEALKFLTKATMRVQYDKALEKAYKNGIIRDEVEDKLNNLIDQARAYYRKGNIQMAAKYAQQAVNGNINDPEAYELLARCYYDSNNYSGALSVIDKGISVFTDDINLHWLGARIAAAGAKDYANAQARINRLIELAPDKAIGHSEQVNLHLLKGDEQLAFDEIDSYISAHPDDKTFKREVAYSLDNHSRTCYYYDKTHDAYIIADKKAYEKCLTLCKKANSIFDDEHTKNMLENAQYYGTKEWNSWNMDSIKCLALYGAIFTALTAVFGGLALIIGLILFAAMGVLIYFSYRPYWLINQSYITGEPSAAEKLISGFGDFMAKAARWLFKALVWLFKTVFFGTIKLALWIASGGPFK